MLNSKQSRLLVLAACLMGVLTLLSSPVQAEWYVAGQIGANVPNSFSNVTGTGDARGSTTSSLNQQTSLAYGAKIGYFFNSAKWLGVEMEVYNSTPHIKQQNVNTTLGSDTETGATVRMTTVAWNAILRYPGTTFQPYVGAGLGVFFANLPDTDANAAPGANLLAGLRCFVTKNVAVFGEYKYNYVNLSFTGRDRTLGRAGFDTTYSANLVMGGISFHF